MTKNLLLVGVGGQGTILVSKILSQGLAEEGYDVKMSEIHGMAQRGGSVTTQIRFGDKVYSPNICEGEADVLVAFEKVEAVRYIRQLRKGGILIVNDVEIYPLPVLTGKEKYPEGVIEELKKNIENINVVNGRKIAEDVGEVKTQNIVLLGCIIKALKLEDINWSDLIRRNVPERFQEVNIKAFNEGLKLL